MSTPTTVVRFRDVRAQPDYAAAHPRGPWNHRGALSRDEMQERLPGEPVAIFLTPKIPDAHWRCGIERVWQVPDEEVVRLTGVAPRPGHHVYVCEHQVEID